MIDLSLDIESPEWLDRIPSLEAMTNETAAAVFREAAPNVAARIDFLFTGDGRLQALNRLFRHQDKPTNVLSFPDASPGSGDIALAFETVEAEARRDGKSFRDHARHLIVHGILHLLGYDHGTDGEAEAMESLEIKILLGFGVADPYVVLT